MATSLKAEAAPSRFKLADHPRLRVALLTLYYLGVLLGLIKLYGRGDFSTPPFVYQGF
jgi:hypothetical protein